MRTFSKKTGIAAAVLTAVAGLSGLAHGALVVDLVPVSAGSSADVVINGNNVTVGSVGDVVHFNLIATVTGSNADTTDEGLQAVWGNLLSTPAGNLTGDFSTNGTSSSFAVNTAFDSIKQAGKLQDINGLPGLDAGFKTGGLSADWVAGRASGELTNTAANAVPASSPLQFLVGSGDWKVTNLATGTSTNLVWSARQSSNTVWFEDGPAGNTSTITGGSYTAGPGISVTATPEPGTLAMAGMAGAGLLLRRRRK